jgi:hypothetical protein
MATIKIKSMEEATTWNQSWHFACWCDGGRREFGLHQGREFIANGALENGEFCTVFSENFHKF